MKLGDVVRDRISGFTGVVTSRTEYLNGCVRWAVSPQQLHEGKPIEAQYFDEEQIEAVDAPAVIPMRRATGGDRPAPVGRETPR
jgi:hypothetical protein